MKAIKLIGFIIAILLVNNFLLLYFMGDISSFLQSGPNQAASGVVLTPSLSQQGSVDSSRKATDVEVVSKLDTAPSMEGHDMDFVATLARAIKRDDFKQIWDQYQIDRSDHYTESQRNLTVLEPFELFDLIQNSTDPIERQVAQQILMNKGMQDLENYQLKELYKNPVFKKWGRSEIISMLMQNSDPEGLSLAKVALLEHNNSLFNSSFDTELVQSVYEKDPDFMMRYVADFDINQTSRFSPIVAFFTQEDKLAKVFLKNNLDKIIGSERKHVLQLGSYFSSVEISPSQQERVIALFDSSNHHKRGLAIALIGSLKNTDTSTLTTLLKKLSRKQEQRDFIRKLYYNSNDPKLKVFAKQLASDSNDTLLKQIVQ